MSGKRIGLALGGGGARGFAHLGVLKVLLESGIPIQVITGTSMGALVAALYAKMGTVEAVTERLRHAMQERGPSSRLLKLYAAERRPDTFLDYVTQRIQQRIIINLSITRKSLLRAERLEAAVCELLEDAPIESLPLTVGILASDLITGKGVVLRNGSLRRAVIASSSIPGFFPPVEWGDMLLVDGEVTDLVPVDAAYALGADFVIAVDVNRDILPQQDFDSTLDIFLRTVRITVHRFTEVGLAKAGYVLRPAGNGIAWSEFHRMEELVDLGERTTRSALPGILEAVAAFDPNRRRFAQEEFARTHLDSATISIGK